MDTFKKRLKLVDLVTPSIQYIETSNVVYLQQENIDYRPTIWIITAKSDVWVFNSISFEYKQRTLTGFVRGWEGKDTVCSHSLSQMSGRHSNPRHICRTSLPPCCHGSSAMTDYIVSMSTTLNCSKASNCKWYTMDNKFVRQEHFNLRVTGMILKADKWESLKITVVL